VNSAPPLGGRGGAAAARAVPPPPSIRPTVCPPLSTIRVETWDRSAKAATLCRGTLPAPLAPAPVLVLSQQPAPPISTSLREKEREKDGEREREGSMTWEGRERGESEKEGEGWRRGEGEGVSAQRGGDEERRQRSDGPMWEELEGEREGVCGRAGCSAA
jgi:hypothetical protein